ncbi:hypothetical protein [Skermanella pratensis]|uniref:hypothetical protein n=1 Tax=Skermanella pratensis TaxID=2233999 RepID=UPI001FE8A59B|nr:hypothetical protein [Skermanella pratensis]
MTRGWDAACAICSALASVASTRSNSAPSRTESCPDPQPQSKASLRAGAADASAWASAGG